MIGENRIRENEKRKTERIFDGGTEKSKERTRWRNRQKEGNKERTYDEGIEKKNGRKYDT